MAGGLDSAEDAGAEEDYGADGDPARRNVHEVSGVNEAADDDGETDGIEGE